MRCSLLHEEGCDWCGKELPAGRRRWCSRKCDDAHTANHRWTQAKAWIKRIARRPGGYLCSRCGEVVQVVDVNHKTPILGKHGTWGCHHHQDNLEVVCKPCHKEITAEQRAAGLFKRD